MKDAYRLDRNNNIVEHTSYVQKLVRIATPQHPAAPRVSITQVQRRLPASGDQLFSTSVHFFSVATDPSMDEYGLPFTKESIPDPGADATVYTRIDGITNPAQLSDSECATACQNGKQLYLSSKVHDAAGNLVRYSFLRYEGGATGDSVADDTNPRISAERTAYADDLVGSTHRQATVDRGDFDGFGHFRVEKTSGNFGAGDVRTITTAWNRLDPDVSSSGPGSGTLPGSWTPWPAGSNWVLNTFTSQTVSEGSQTAKTLACFEAATGFLLRSRTLKGAAAGAEDLVTINTPDISGNIVKQQFFGGDNAGLATSALCSAAFGNPPYDIRHSYVAGTRATSQYFNNGAAMSFFSLDQTVDASTGLVSETRDITGLLTSTLSYDPSGRLRVFRPPGTNFDATYTFSPATVSTKAKVDVSQPSAASGSLQTKTTFDDFGRVEKEEQLMPNGSWSSRVTKYDDLGNKADVSELESGTPSHFLVAVRHNYQPFGDMTVGDTYTYAAPAGQVSQRVTSIAQNGIPIRTATQTFAYDDLGAPVDIGYPACPNCGSAMWDRVRQSYANGSIVGVSAEKNPGGAPIAFAAGITYWPNGMMNVLTHGNGVTDTIGADLVGASPTAMARPGSTTFAGWSACVSADIQGDSGDQTISSGGTATLTVFPNGGASAPLSYQWYSGSTEIAQASGQTYVAGPLTSTTTFSVVVSNACGRKRSRTITVTVCSKPSNVQITPGSMTIASGQSLGLSASATGSGISFQWFQNGTQVATGATYNTPALAATTTYFVRVVNTCGAVDSAVVTYTVPLAKPAALAAARSGTAAVVISWSPAPAAHHYQLERRSGGQPYAVIATVTASPFTDTLSIAANTTYVYRLRAFDASGGSASPYSDPDLATTKTFSAIIAGTAIISYADLNELLSALNMVRAANGSPPLGWPSIAPGVLPPAVGELIRGAHLAGLRTAMNQALSSLGISSDPYTDSSLTDVIVKAVHVEQLRGRTQ